ncbi:hypothetical protein NDU88_002190 [Pleurodeles waltl]|uniref:Uncharacterized protein n=1 Tax=Pleurodeles waltl TaxID=8319 RepID=A0AAV7NGE3_PLEWA|nr:hypothetical protein NDU88_002190 [Pleurodeles waltl]
MAEERRPGTTEGRASRLPRGARTHWLGSANRTVAARIVVTGRASLPRDSPLREHIRTRWTLRGSRNQESLTHGGWRCAGGVPHGAPLDLRTLLGSLDDLLGNRDFR